MSDTFLDKVYTARTPEETRDIYNDWSASYEDEVAQNGYATPARLARLLAEAMPDRAAPVLDFGCGTGLSGAALHAAGLTTLDGMDLSPDMLAKARDKGVYRSLMQVSADGGPPALPGDYAAIAAVGVIGAGAAPLVVFHDILASLGTGALFAFSFNDHTLSDPAYPEAVATAIDSGDYTQLAYDYGEHLPGRDMKSAIYILRKQ